MKKPTEQQIEEAKAVLTNAGYSVKSIWHINDVKAIKPKISNKKAMQVLDNVLNFTIQYINETIEEAVR